MQYLLGIYRKCYKTSCVLFCIIFLKSINALKKIWTIEIHKSWSHHQPLVQTNPKITFYIIFACVCIHVYVYISLSNEVHLNLWSSHFHTAGHSETNHKIIHVIFPREHVQIYTMMMHWIIRSIADILYKVARYQHMQSLKPACTTLCLSTVAFIRKPNLPNKNCRFDMQFCSRQFYFKFDSTLTVISCKIKHRSRNDIRKNHSVHVL